MCLPKFSQPVTAGINPSQYLQEQLGLEFMQGKGMAMPTDFKCDYGYEGSDYLADTASYEEDRCTYETESVEDVFGQFDYGVGSGVCNYCYSPIAFNMPYCSQNCAEMDAVQNPSFMETADVPAEDNTYGDDYLSELLASESAFAPLTPPYTPPPMEKKPMTTGQTFGVSLPAIPYVPAADYDDSMYIPA